MSSTHALVHALRSNKVAEVDKLQLARSAVTASTVSPSTASQLRDWIFDSFHSYVLAQKRHRNGPSNRANPLLEKGWWQILSQTNSLARPTSAHVSTLPALDAIPRYYAESELDDEGLLQEFTAVAREIIPVCVQRAHVDGVLDAFATIVESVNIIDGTRRDRPSWTALVEIWLNSIKLSLETGVSGKRAPQQVLPLMPAIIIAAKRCSPAARDLMLASVALAVFNLEALRKGFARETYKSGDVSDAGGMDDSSAAGAFFTAIDGLSDDLAAFKDLCAILPEISRLYFASLERHSETLFPLSAKLTFNSPAAHRSALELHTLQRRRALAGDWINRLLSLTRWIETMNDDSAAIKAVTLALDQIAENELYRDGEKEGWAGVMEDVMRGTVLRLDKPGIFSLLLVILKLSPDAVLRSISKILEKLVSVSDVRDGAEFANALLQHRVRAGSVGTHLLEIAAALGSEEALPENALTAFAVQQPLQRALAGLVRAHAEDCARELLSGCLQDDAGMLQDEDGRSRKRRKLGDLSTARMKGAAARIRILALLLRSMSAIPTDDLRDQIEFLIEPHLKVPTGADDDGAMLTFEVLELRCSVIDRLVRDGVAVPWTLKKKRVTQLARIIDEGRAKPMLVVAAAKTLLHHISQPNDKSRQDEQSEAALTSILQRCGMTSMTPPTPIRLRTLNAADLSFALWATVMPQWVETIDTIGTETQLGMFADILLARCRTASDEEIERLLRRADIPEFPRLKAQIESALLRLLDDGSPQEADLIRRFCVQLPPEFFSKPILKRFLQNFASVDDGLQNEASRVSWRKWVALLLAMKPGHAWIDLEQAYKLLHTKPSSALLTSVTLNLWREVLRAFLSRHQTLSDTNELGRIIGFFDQPLAGLARQSKSTVSRLTAEDAAFVVFGEELVSSLSFSELSREVQVSLRAVLSQCTERVDQALSSFTSQRSSSDSATISAGLVDVLSATWRLLDWAGIAEEHPGRRGRLVLALLASTTLGNIDGQVPASILDLFLQQMHRHRSNDNSNDTLAFETMIASCIALQATSTTTSWLLLKPVLASACSSATPGEYKAGLTGLVELVCSHCAGDSATQAALPQVLSVMSIAVSHPPEGTGKVSARSLETVLRAIVAALSEKRVGVETGIALELSIVDLVAPVVTDQPRLVSRTSASCILAIILSFLSPREDSLPPSVMPKDATRLFNDSLGILIGLVRHHKDHITPLLPFLIRCITSALALLRRTGSSHIARTAEASIDESLQRSSRTQGVRNTFPSWAWSAGPSCIGRDEARLLGRLLESLTAKAPDTKSRRAVGGAAVTRSLAGPISKHGAFILLAYVRASVDSRAPILAPLRHQLQGGLFAIMDALGEWELKALLTGFLGAEEEAERKLLRDLWTSWDRSRYKG